MNANHPDDSNEESTNFEKFYESRRDADRKEIDAKLLRLRIESFYEMEPEVLSKNQGI